MREHGKCVIGQVLNRSHGNIGKTKEIVGQRFLTEQADTYVIRDSGTWQPGLVLKNVDEHVRK